jgi:hypothetical protein
MGHRKIVTALPLHAAPGAPRSPEQGPALEAAYGGLNFGATPPFDFDGVTLRVFPLRARLDRLQRFVDGYVNLIPREAGYFRAFLPYVYLMVINYGRMSIDAENLGWVSQHEVTFSVPLEWYREQGGRLVFQDWAYISPFIYVDNELSMKTGREVYGWPKVMAWPGAEMSAWMEKSPAAPTRLVRVSTSLFPQAYAGLRGERRPLLEVECTGSEQAGMQWPPDLESSWLPWVALPNALKGSTQLLGDSVELLKGLGLLHHQEGAGAVAWAKMLAQLGRQLNPYKPQLYFNTLNLKQFRDAARPELACYQSLTNARMELRRYNRGGPLGGLQVLQGDVSGSYRIRLHDHPLQPIMDSLGLEVAGSEGPESARIYTLRPVLPFWLDVDMRYGLGETLAWRTADSPHWRYPGAPPHSEPSTVSPAHYNTRGGGAMQEIAGPYEFLNTTLRVLPLLADRQRLQTFCDGWLNQPLAGQGFHLEPWGEHVFLVATSYEEMFSPANNVGWWAEREVTFLIPVKEYAVGPGGERRLRGVALVPAFAYMDSSMAAITRSEVSGVPTEQATLESPPDKWMGEAGPSERTLQPLLCLKTLVLPALGEGQKAQERVLLEIHEGEPQGVSDEHQRLVTTNWGERLRRMVDQCNLGTEPDPQRVAQAVDDGLLLALEPLARRTPLKLLTLKQFRDVEDPNEACYQALIETHQSLQEVYDLREIESPLMVRLHHYPSMPVAELLGLVPVSLSAQGGSMVYNLQPVRPFWMKVSMRVDTGRTLLWRANGEDWKPGVGQGLDRPCYLDSGAGPGQLSRELLRALDGDMPQRLRLRVQRWHERSQQAEPLSLESAREAMERVSPHTLLERVLSREWEHWGQPRWYQALLRLKNQLSYSSGDSEAELENIEDFLDDVRNQTRRKEVAREVERAQEALRQARPDPYRGAPQAAPQIPDLLQNLLKLLRASHWGPRLLSGEQDPEAHQQLIWRLCQGYQKPDHCVPADVLAGTWLRSEHYWTDKDSRKWYVGLPPVLGQR